MNLEEFDVPETFAEMKVAFERCYNSFYLEMVRMSNANLTSYIECVLRILAKLSRSADTTDQLRSAMGIVSLHNFGFKNFEQLSQIFDRLIPQIEPEAVKFTSWCAGQLIAHPNFEQSQYVQHLMNRSFGWIRNRGKRARHLAAACLIENLAMSAGSTIISFLPQIQSALWSLASQPSVHVISATSSAFATFTRTILSYGRSDLESFLDFSTELTSNFLLRGSAIKRYAALILFQRLIERNSDYFMPKFGDWLALFSGALNESEKPIIRAAAYATVACLSEVDAKQFKDVGIEMLLAKTGDFISEFSKEVVGALCVMVKNVPEHMCELKEELVGYCCGVLSEKYDLIFTLLMCMVSHVNLTFSSIKMELLSRLIESPVTLEYRNFFVRLTKADRELSDEFRAMFTKRILRDLKDECTEQTLEMLAELPHEALIDIEKIIEALSKFTMDGPIKLRAALPRALFHLSCMLGDEKRLQAVEQLMQVAVFDNSSIVRCQVFRVFSKNLCKELARPDFMKFYEIFVNDDSQTARNLALNLLTGLVQYNPMYVAAITRNSLLDYFFLMQNVPSVRQRARHVRTLPSLIKASTFMIESYSATFMEIAMSILREHTVKKRFDNFLEEDADMCILSGIVQSMALLAPVDPVRMANSANEALPIVCDYLRTMHDRQLALSIFKFFEVLLKPPASSLVSRLHTPMIMSVCSEFLAKTRSRKARITILKVFGAMGVLEVQHRQPSRICKSPENMDPALTREFFQPSRDIEDLVDDTLLLSPDTQEEYTIKATSAALLRILKDDNLKEYYGEAINILVHVLGKPRMSILTYYDAFCARFLELMESSIDDEFACYLPMLTNLIHKSGNNISPFTGRIVTIIQNRFCNKLSIPLMDLVMALTDAVRDGIAPYSAVIMCLLIGSLDDGKTTQKEKSCHVLHVCEKICLYAQELDYLVIPQICDAIVCEQTLDDVRIAAVNCLQKLLRTTDLFARLGPIVRSLFFCLEHDEPRTKAAALQLINTLVCAQGRKFVENAGPLIQYLKSKKLISLELKRMITQVTQNPNHEAFQPILEPKTDLPDAIPTSPSSTFIFSEDTIVSRAFTPSYGGERYMEQWLRSFKLSVVANSPSEQVRLCAALAGSYTQLAKDLFKIAFLWCWNSISTRGRVQISKSLIQMLLGPHVLDSVAREIIDLLMFMKKVNQPLIISREEIIAACMKYGNVAFALMLITEHIREVGRINEESMSDLVEIYSQLNIWPNATWIWKKNKAEKDNVDVLRRLKLWDRIEPRYRHVYEQTKDFSAFRLLSESLNSLAKWPELLEYYSVFKSELTRNQQRDVSEYFASAAFNVGRWDILDDVLKHAPNYSFRSTVLSALNALHKGDFEETESFVNKGFWLLASKPITFWGENQRIRRDTLLSCQQLVEIQEMVTWVQCESKRQEIENVWLERMKTAPQDFSMWYKIIGNRARITNRFTPEIIPMFQLKSQIMGTKLHANVFRAMFSGFDFDESTDDLSRLCYVMTLWTIGKRDEALQKITKLAETATTFESTCRFFYASWLTESDPTKEGLQEAYRNLSMCMKSLGNEPPQKRSLIHKQTSRSESLLLPSETIKSLSLELRRVDMIRKWAEVNIELSVVDPENIEKYITNAIDALAKCAQTSPMFPDVVQLLNLFFENADKQEIFNSTAHSCIRTLSPKLLLQASPQLLVQLSQSSPEVAKFVHDTVFDLLKDHYHELVYSVSVMKYSKDKERAKMSRQILDEFRSLNPRAWEEVKLIRTTMLRAAVTWNEKVQQRITDALDHVSVGMYDMARASLASILSLVARPKCEMHENFRAKHRYALSQLESLLQNFNQQSPAAVRQLSQWCKEMDEKLLEDIRRIRTLQLVSISPALAEKTDFVLAVPGTYKPSKPIIRIKYFVGQFSVYMSKQQPKDIVVMGDDGHFYQYLLKGHEDLRLDERIMQFFSVINSLLKKDSTFRGQLIEAMSVIPLSISHGLVQWVPGTDTLRAIVEQHRKIHKKEPLMEYQMTESLGHSTFDFMEPIQKLQIIEKIFRQVPDTDLADFFWLKSGNSEDWLKQTCTFAVTCALTSIVGYVIGLGDRHPSNLLIDRNTGKLIHIDFGDCFELAAKRNFLPEVVPFRLTRMMVRAMGVVGYNGLFRTAFQNMSTLLRENKRVLIIVLAIFVQEPLVGLEQSDKIDASNSPVSPVKYLSKATTGSVIDKGRVYMTTGQPVMSSVELRNRIRQKLSGTDFDTPEPLSVETQATRLIEMATNTYNMARMYSGWCPFW